MKKCKQCRVRPKLTITYNDDCTLKNIFFGCPKCGKGLRIKEYIPGAMDYVKDTWDIMMSQAEVGEINNEPTN